MCQSEIGGDSLDNTFPNKVLLPIYVEGLRSGRIRIRRSGRSGPIIIKYENYFNKISYDGGEFFIPITFCRAF